MRIGTYLAAPFFLLGRIVFGAAIAAQGVICLAFRDFVHSLQPAPANLPEYETLALLNGILLIAAGLAIVSNWRSRPLALVLAMVFVLGIAVLHIPDAVSDPELLRSPFWIRTFESLALAGAAVIVAGLATEPLHRTWISAGRFVFGVSLPVFGILHFVYPENVAALIETATPVWPWPLFLAYLTGLAHFFAGLGLAIAAGAWGRWAGILAGFMYATWALTLHLPRILEHPAARSIDNPAGYGGDRGELTSLFVCVAFWGAAWIAAGSLPVRISLHPTAR
jgi:uncharacterized membrane protein YphA (DoxX/SURF4 family)